MRNTTKRLLSLVMVIALMLTLAPLSVFAAGTGTTVYLKPNSNWTQGNAWFAAYYWDTTDHWIELTDTDGDGIYEGVIPDGYTNVIFCRMNPEKTALDWTSKWDQTVDLTLDGTNNCFTVGDGQWNSATGTWSVHTPAGGGDDTEESESTEATTESTGGSKSYTLIGYINGADNGHGDDWEGTGYPFVDGKVTVTITETSYVYVKTTDNANWYLTETYVTDTTGIFKTGATEKMMVPAGTVTFTLVENADGTLTLSYTTDGSSSGGNEGGESGGNEGGNTGLTGDFYLIGNIDGADYGDGDDYANLGDYKFVNGQVTATFTQTSYVCIKSADMVWYMTDGWQGEVTSAKLYNTNSYTPATKFDKLMVPAGTATFTLVDNGDDTYTLSYTTDGSGGGDVGGGDDEGGSDVPTDGTIPTGDYYLFGYINGADYGTGDDYANLGDYKFVNGSLTTTFPSDSYVGVKNAAMDEWFQTKGWQGAKTAVVLQNSQGSSATDWDKMFVPGSVALTFSLRKNSDGTMTLSYVRNEVKGVQDTSGVQSGVTLHCWNWSYNNIAANMEAIADAGYTAIQTSPAQGMKEATKDVSATKWWLFYQPVNFSMNTSTDNALGTKAEFEAMCKVADQYGIKVIVDVVANHLGNKTGNDLADLIPDELRNSAYWHDITTDTSDYTNRYDITQHCMSGLPDLNTANEDVQNYVLNYLKECIDAGADGFRFDATKHIETPYEDGDYASDFWPTVIGGAEAYAKNKGFDLYCYGELLDNPGGDKMSIVEYTEFLAVTDNSWGNQLRGEINTSSASYNLKGYNKVAAPNQLVLWAESHDTYGNESKESTNISVANINKTWALVAARGDAMGLYFARPANFATDTLGMGGTNTGWANPEVVAVNKFHNAFNGQSEKSGNSDGIAYVVRGDSGVVLVNYQGTSKSVSGLDVGMADGTYTDQVTGTTFTVSNGNISGSIGSTGIAVVYNAEEEHEHDYKTTVTPPTCTTGGYTTYTCSGCGHSYVSDEVPATDHNYVDGTCSDCGAADPNYVVPVEKFDIPYSQMELGNALNLHFLFPVSACDDWTGAYAVITKSYADGRADVTVTVPAADWGAENYGVDYHDAAFTNIAAKEMTDEITIVVYNADGVAISNPRTDSIRNYLLRNLENYDSAELRALVVDMLNYGAAAQEKFNYNTSDLANKDLTAEQKAFGTATMKTCTDKRVKGANFQGTGLELNNSIVLNMYFNGLTSDMTAKVTFTDHNNQPVTADAVIADGIVFVDQIVVADARQLVTVTVYDANGSVYGTATDSLESCVARASASDTIYQAIMKFADSAYAYLH